MRTISLADFKNTFHSVLDNICEDFGPVTILRENKLPSVMMSLDDYNALREKAHLSQMSEDDVCFDMAIDKPDNFK